MQMLHGFFSVKLCWIALTLHEKCNFLQISPSIIVWLRYCYGNGHHKDAFLAACGALEPLIVLV